MAKALLGELLVSSKVITREQLEEVLAAPRPPGKKIGQLLIERGLLTEGQLTQTLSLQLGVPWVSLYHIDFSRQLLNRVPKEMVQRLCLVPIFVRNVKSQGDTLYVATDDPKNETALGEVSRAAKLPVRPMIASPSDIRSAIRVYYEETGQERSLADAMKPEPLTRPDGVTIPPSGDPAPAPAQTAARKIAAPSSPPPAMTREAAPATTANAPSTPPMSAEPASTDPVSIEPEPESGDSTPQLDGRDEAPAVVRFAETIKPAEVGLPPEKTPPPVEQPAAAAPDPQPARSEPPPRPQSSPDAPTDTPKTGDVPKTPASGPKLPGTGGPTKRPRMVALTLLDGTQLSLPARGRKRQETAPPSAGGVAEQLTARDLVSALRAVSHGADASEILGDAPQWEPILAALLSILLRKGMIADWEFIDEYRKI